MTRVLPGVIVGPGVGNGVVPGGTVGPGVASASTTALDGSGLGAGAPVGAKNGVGVGVDVSDAVDGLGSADGAHAEKRTAAIARPTPIFMNKYSRIIPTERSPARLPAILRA